MLKVLTKRIGVQGALGRLGVNAILGKQVFAGSNSSLSRFVTPWNVPAACFASPQKPKKYKLKSNKAAVARFIVKSDGTVWRKQMSAHHKSRYNSRNKRLRKSKRKQVLNKKVAKMIRRLLLAE